MPEVSIDASFSLKLVLDEPDRERVQRQWATWRDAGYGFFVPWLWFFESHATLRSRITTGELDEAEAMRAWRALLGHGVSAVSPEGMFDRAWVLARELSQRRTYDMAYFAVAELLGCELWTADKKVVNAAQGRFPWLHYVDELP